MIYVLGGSGFIGSRLCSRLKDTFRIIDKSKSTLFASRFKYADITNLSGLMDCFDSNGVIINLAAEHRDNVSPKSLYYEVNVLGAQNVCLIARTKKINTIIFTSSVAIYGFAKLGTNENGIVDPFNEYGDTKWKAEQIYKAWQSEDPKNRTLVIIRPTVVFGEKNRGNVFHLLKQIASGSFVMIGDGRNRKSMAYVENVAAFIEYSLNFKSGLHIYNYIDKPDFTMNSLVSRVNKILGRSDKINFRLPYFIGLAVGKCFDCIAFVARKKLAISSIRVKKFCANSVYDSAISKTGFVPPVPLLKAIERTIRYEFIEDHKKEPVYFSE